jgi:hypothetical protein
MNTDFKNQLFIISTLSFMFYRPGFIILKATDLISKVLKSNELKNLMDRFDEKKLCISDSGFFTIGHK